MQDDAGGRNIPVQFGDSGADLIFSKKRHFALEVELQFIFIQAEYVQFLAEPAIDDLTKGGS